jgi:hypothetical protein
LAAPLPAGLSEELKWVDAFGISAKSRDACHPWGCDFGLNAYGRWPYIVGDIDKCAFQRARGRTVFGLGTLWVICLEWPASREEHRDGRE